MASSRQDSEASSGKQHFLSGLASKHLGALWQIYAESLTPEPVTREVPVRWAWREMRPLLYQAAQTIPSAEAERRVLVLLNPGLDGAPAVTPTLYAGLQIILPGEVARSHRHSPNAIRLMIEGAGAYTTVNGELTLMHPGDFVTTPNWVWHNHGNESPEPAIWLDGLDLPLVSSLSAIFYERDNRLQQTVLRTSEVSSGRYARGFRPAYEKLPRHYSPIINYPYKEARSALSEMARTDTANPYDGFIIQYLNPLTGESVLPTIDGYLQWIAPGQRLAEHQHTSSSVYLGIEGRGVVEIDGQGWDWEPHDVIVVPSWCRHRHVNPGGEPAVLFSFTDEPALKKLALYREKAD